MKPVAWMQTFTQSYQGKTETKHTVNLERIGINDIPLYTAPRELSDEEILKIIKKHEAINGNIDTYDVLACVKAILKKASEK